MDSVDKPVNGLSPRVTNRPDGGLDIPHAGNHPREEPSSATQRDNEAGPNGRGLASGPSATGEQSTDPAAGAAAWPRSIGRARGGSAQGERGQAERGQKWNGRSSGTRSRAGGQSSNGRSSYGRAAANRGAADQPTSQRQPTDQPAEQPPTGPTSGRDLAHAALEAAKAKAKERGAPPNLRRGRITGGGGQNPRRRRWSGSGADARDPQPLGRLVSRLISDSGWQDTMTNARVFGQWARLVGEDVAEHAEPVALKDGELTVRASSTAWATQLRLLQGKLLAKIAAGVGHGVVKRMRIQGPTAPSWRKGPRHVPGRGPRDTYG